MEGRERGKKEGSFTTPGTEGRSATKKKWGRERERRSASKTVLPPPDSTPRLCAPYAFQLPQSDCENGALFLCGKAAAVATPLGLRRVRLVSRWTWPSSVQPLRPPSDRPKNWRTVKPTSGIGIAHKIAVAADQLYGLASRPTDQPSPPSLSLCSLLLSLPLSLSLGK